jgi:hypothetical protein
MVSRSAVWEKQIPSVTASRHNDYEHTMLECFRRPSRRIVTGIARIVVIMIVVVIIVVRIRIVRVVDLLITFVCGHASIIV